MTEQCRTRRLKVQQDSLRAGVLRAGTLRVRVRCLDNAAGGEALAPDGGVE